MTTNRRPHAFRMRGARSTRVRAAHARSSHGARRIDAPITHERRSRVVYIMPAIEGAHPQHGLRTAAAQVTHDRAPSTKERRTG